MIFSFLEEKIGGLRKKSTDTPRRSLLTFKVKFDEQPMMTCGIDVELEPLGQNRRKNVFSIEASNSDFARVQTRQCVEVGRDLRTE